MKLFISLLILFTSSADGLPLFENRFSGGASTIIELLPEQLSELNKSGGYSWEKQIYLTDFQKKLLELQTNINSEELPTKISVLKVQSFKNECTCGSSNFGILIKTNLVEIPHSYLVSDNKSKEMKEFE